MVTFGSLFSGIGGMDLGLERAGWECRWQVEIDPYCSRVLAKHWPDVPRYGDIRTVTGDELAPVDLIAGGFPCQDISDAGKRVGIDGERSSLWGDMARIVGVVRPRFVLVENVSALLDRGMGRVLGDLAALRFDAEWSVLSACSMGASHTRERVFIVAYAPAECLGWQWGRIERAEVGDRQRDVPHWPDQPEPDRVADGVPRRVDRNCSLGNAVVPQVAEYIGHRIRAALEATP